mgnify:CR=1 FL=1
MEQVSFHENLKNKMDSYAHYAYSLTRSFPKEELFGITSQLRRAALSVILNYIEGYARMARKSNRQFLDIAYGSLKESKYLLHFSFKENYLSEANYKKGVGMAEEIGAMLWSTIKGLGE